jgi:hypothetical protein
MIGDAGEAKKRKRSRESEAAFRAKNRFWRATMRREAGGHKNFFIAKYRDSESTQHAFSRHQPAVAALSGCRSTDVRMKKMPAAQSLSAILTIACVRFSYAIGIAAPMCRGVIDQRAARALAPARQHFLKRDAVFSTVLVYSGCSASRFPSARSD